MPSNSNEYMRKYYEKNKEKLAERNINYYYMNKERMCELQKGYYRKRQLEKGIVVRPHKPKSKIKLEKPKEELVEVTMDCEWINPDFVDLINSNE